MGNHKYRVAIIGSGMIANAGHIPAWLASGEADVVGVANPGIESAQATASRFKIPHVFTNPQQMLDKLRPDIVTICTPNVYHKEWTLSSLKAGAHVLCEKPVATSYQDAYDMFQAAEMAGKRLYVAQTVRFQNVYKAARDFTIDGRLGEIYFAEGSYIRRRGIPTWGKFHMKVHNAGGPLWDLGVHVLDFLFWIMANPEVKSVSGMVNQKIGNRDEGLETSLEQSGAHGGIFSKRPYDFHEFDVEDFATGYIRLKNGCIVIVKVSWAINLPDHSSFSIAGTEAGMQLPPLKIMLNSAGYQSEVIPKVPSDQEVAFSGHYGLVRNFINALEGREEMIVKPEEVLNVMKIIEGLYRSAAEGKEIQLID